MQYLRTENFSMPTQTKLRSKNSTFAISDNNMSGTIMETNNENLSSPQLGNSRRRHRNIRRQKIEEKAIQKFRAGGYGLNYVDLMDDFHLKKSQAQLTLKQLHHKGIFFTAGDLSRQGINLIKNKKPQVYFPSSARAEILEKLKKKGVSSNSELLLSTISPLQKYALGTALEYQKAQNFLDILTMLPYRPPYIHRLLLALHINTQCYAELRKIKGKNKSEIYEELIGRRHVKFTLSSNGTVQIAVTTNSTPFKLESEQDISIIFSFFGQIRDRLLSLLTDPKELLVPSVMEWILKQCDLNKDIEIDGKAQLTLFDIQLTHMDRVFRQYVKIIEGKAYYRTEESLQLNEVLPAALDNIKHPYKSLEKKIDDLLGIIKGLLDQKMDAKIEVALKAKTVKQEKTQYNEPYDGASNFDAMNGNDNGEDL